MRRLIDPMRVDPVPWLNGAGSTRELASAASPDGEALWRISVADLDRDAEFSTFQRTNRLFVPLGPLTLTVDGSEVSCEAGDQIRFDGEIPVSARVPAPTRALNVMAQRGTFVAEVSLHSRHHVPARRPATTVAVLLGGFVAEIRILPLYEEFHD